MCARQAQLLTNRNETAALLQDEPPEVLRLFLQDEPPEVFDSFCHLKQIATLSALAYRHANEAGK